MKNLFRIKFLAIVALLSVFLTSCEEDEAIVVPDTTITGLAKATPSLSILVQALVKADLAATLQGTGPFTVFAPTDAAFKKFLTDNNFADLNTVPGPLLKQVLLNHVVSGSVQASGLVNNTYIKTLAIGSASTSNALSMYVNTTAGVKLNGVSNVNTTTPGSTFNVIASNGVIHLVDAVIGLPTIVTHATANPNFSKLVENLTTAGLVATFTPATAGPFTVFAPANLAFTNLADELAAIPFVPSVAQLTNVLKYHVVNGNILAAGLPAVVAAGPVTTLNPQTFTISLTGGAKITGSYSPARTASNVVITDVQCSNGVIHVLDKVLLPQNL